MNVMEMIEPPIIGLEDEIEIPADITDWVTKAELRGWIAELVDSLSWNNPELLERLKHHPEFEPRALLCTLTLAYATGVFSAEDIVRCCSRDAEFRPIRPTLAPLASDISTFRKLNRALLKELVAHVITRALKTQFIEGDSIRFFPAGLRRMIVENATERLDIARHMDRSGEA